MNHYKKLITVILIMIFFGTNLKITAQDEEIKGIWQSIGYGLWFSIDESTVNIYQSTAVSCVHMLDIESITYTAQSVILHNASLAGIGQYLGKIEYELTLEDGLLNFEVGKINPIQAERANSMPSLCDEITTDTPQNNFETFWNMFSENYAFFDVRGVDWQSTYDTYQPMVTSETTDEELFAIFQEMITPLGDGHSSIHTLFGSFSPLTIPNWFEATSDDALAQYATIVLDNYLIDAPKIVANDLIQYGRLSETVGYINILGFAGFSDDGNDIDILNNVMATILDEFQGMETIVVDVRFNAGGDDTNSIFIAGQFTDERHLAFSKSVWENGEFYSIMDIFVEPTTDTPFMGNVYVLTSGISVSAAETFALAMSTIATVTLVGEPTNGIFSDMWFVMLSNGWIATLSNERYLSADGILYESLGVPPDIEILLTAENFATGHDPIVEEILGLTQ